MSIVESPVLRPAYDWHRSSLAEWSALEEKTRTRCKVVVLVGLVVLAYHYSLLSLVQTIGLDTPLAYVGLVPLIAAGLAWVNRRPRAVEPAIHDRQLDYIIGLFLLSTAVAAAAVLPGRMGDMYWVNRVDLLFLPLFVAGATVLLFGVRVAWRQKVALGYLFLGWPWIYSTVLLGTLGGFTSFTLQGLNASLRVFHVAQTVPGNAGLYQVVHDGRVFPISVVTACSGVDGMVGFFLIGAALAAIVSGSLVRKVLWLATGLGLLWVTNLVRLLLIFWTGEKAGERVALGVLHPVAGLVMFCVGVGLMALLMRPFGLNRVVAAASSKQYTRTGVSAAPRVFAAVGVLLVSAVVLSVDNSSLKSYDLVAGATGEPKIGSFLADPANPAGWTATFETEYTINKPLFGEDSRWFRYLYASTSPGLTDLHSTLPVTADVIDAGSLSGFNAYGVTACYSFHGYTLRDVSSVDLGDGVNGQALSYSGGSSDENWSIVYWIVPVATGSGTRFERVILYLQNTPAGTVSMAPRTPGTAPLTAAVKGLDSVQRRLLTNQAFLVAFARQVIAGQTRQQDAGVFIDSVQTPGTAPAVTGQTSVVQSVASNNAGPMSLTQANRVFVQAIERSRAQAPTSTGTRVGGR
ncbi:MAG TPA: exosortase/archaeosortase family protein [Acidimicrobiales bacterium]|nr:exosortase/archaeosortase family protein [Acidimicrobiales bacterium]